MDATQFDDLLRSLVATPSRRGLLHALMGLTLSAPLSALLGLGDAQAKKKHKKKHKKCKSCTACQQCLKGRCKPKPDGADCGGNKVCQSGECVCPTACCSNGDCGFQGACESGTCDCKSGAKFCQGTCIPEGDCCTDDECPDPRVCDGGDCACPSGQKDCDGDCIPEAACCDAADCDSGESCLANGSCGITCNDTSDCPGACYCSIAPNGEKECLALEQSNVCNQPECVGTVDCPSGRACAIAYCFNVLVGRCALLC